MGEQADRQGAPDQPAHRVALKGSLRVSEVQGKRRDAPRAARRPRLSKKKIDEIIQATLQTKPRGATHWSTRTLAREVGVSRVTVNRVWRSHGIQPQRERSFKLCKDLECNERVTDGVGLYTNTL